MTKRPASESLSSNRAVKKPLYARDRLSNLSDELLLRILSNVSVQSLSICQRVSKRISTLASDSQLWKAAYYNRFIRPRAARLPGMKSHENSVGKLDYASKASIWLGEEKLVRAGKNTDWKKQYKLSNNWSRGSCDVSEIALANRRSVPPLLAKLQNGIIYTVDSTSGLRAWSYKNERKLLAQTNKEQLEHMGIPTSIAVDSQFDNGCQRVVVGFADGHFSCYAFRTLPSTFCQIFEHSASSNGRISSLAFAWPYLVSMTESCLLSVYKFTPNRTDHETDRKAMIPCLLVSLKAHTVWPPLSLSLRLALEGPVVSIAFSVPSYVSGWSAGIQEIRMDGDGKVIESRLTTAFDQGFNSLAARSAMKSDNDQDREQNDAQLLSMSSPAHSVPTSLSYSHPYLLMSHSDNTLTLYLVTSTTSGLTISPGRRLWGHTSSVSGAHIADRGKAVSVGSGGNELRIWELEGSTMHNRTRTRPAPHNYSVQVNTGKLPGSPLSCGFSEAISCRGTRLGLASHDVFDDHIIARGVGFDDENVIVIRENICGTGSEALLVYDFT